MHRLGGILSQFTLKVSGKFALAGKGDAGGEDMGLLEIEELWSSGMHADTGSVMGKILHSYQYLVTPLAFIIALRIH